jgi:TolB-like protein
MSSVWGELKRRNVVRVAVAYTVVAWLLLQVADTILDNIEAPAWVFQAILLLLVLGLPIALIFAWAFEITPEGVRKEKDVVRDQSITPVTGRRLDFVIIGVLTVALIVFAVDRFSPGSGVPPESAVDDEIIVTEGRQSIAVMPFVNMSSDPEQEYFSDGLTEEVLNLLAKIPTLKVIARTSSFAFKGKNEDVRDIGKTLDVKTILEGSVRKSGERIRITAQLIDVSDGSHLWSDTYDRTLDDVFTIQDDVAAAIINALQVHVGSAPTRGRPTESTEAYALFLKARSLIRDAKFDDAEVELLRAVELDPEFAEAEELLAYRSWFISFQQEALEWAGKALDSDPDLVLARAIYRSAKTGSYLDGVLAFEQAVTAQPGNPDLLQPFSYNLLQAGYIDQAIGVARQFVEVDPLSTFANGWIASVLYASNQDRESMVARRTIAELTGDNSAEMGEKGIKALLEHRDGDAINYFESAYADVDFIDRSLIAELLAAGRDSENGSDRIDNVISVIVDNVPEDEAADWKQELRQFLMYFGFLDRYYEVIFELDPGSSAWNIANIYLTAGIIGRRFGFTAHPRFIELAETMGIIEVWDKRGPPDFCDKIDGQWVCT